MSVTELEEARRAEGLNADGSFDGSPAASAAERAEEAASYEPDQEELFPLGTIEGDKKTIKTLIRGSLPVKVTASLTSAKVDMTGGLPDPDKPGQVMVSHEPAKYLLIPQREGEPGDKRIVGWEIRCQLRATYSEPGRKFVSREQVVDILHQLGLTGDADRVAEVLDGVFGGA